MTKVGVGVDPELDATFPGQRAARVAIEPRAAGARSAAADPQRRSRTCRCPTRSSKEKFCELAAPVLGRRRGRRSCCGGWKRNRHRLAQALFAPRAVALVGASGDATKNTARPQRYLRKHGYAGRIVPIKPRARRCSARARTAARRAPGEIDHAFIMVDEVEQALEDCAQARRAGREHLQQRLRRRRQRGRRAAGALVAAGASARRAAARAEQHGRGRHARAARADGQRGARDGCAARGQHEPHLAERHHARHAALARRRARAGLREAGFGRQRSRPGRRRAGGPARRRRRYEGHPALPGNGARRRRVSRPRRATRMRRASRSSPTSSAARRLARSSRARTPARSPAPMRRSTPTFATAASCASTCSRR